jgi:hypothetical protein
MANELVLQPWLSKLSFKEQTGLLSAIRGIDDKDDDELYPELKNVTKMIRFIVLKNADDKTEFMTTEVNDPKDMVIALNIHAEQIKNSKYEQGHWYQHILMAVRTILKKHPSPYIRFYWSGFYGQLKITDIKELTNQESG